MARLNKQVLGRVSGAVGDIVFRERNGKNFIGLKPSRFMPGTDEASIARRARFALNAKLASTINNNDELKSIWFNKAPSGLSSHNFILRQNYPLVAPNGWCSGVSVRLWSIGGLGRSPLRDRRPRACRIPPLGDLLSLATCKG